MLHETKRNMFFQRERIYIFGKKELEQTLMHTESQPPLGTRLYLV